MNAKRFQFVVGHAEGQGLEERCVVDVDGLDEQPHGLCFSSRYMWWSATLVSGDDGKHRFAG